MPICPSLRVQRKGVRFSPRKSPRKTSRRRSLTPRSLHQHDGASSEQSSNIRVVVRVRPENEREVQSNCSNVVHVVDNRMLVFDPEDKPDDFYYRGVKQKCRDLSKKAKRDTTFMFDQVFDEKATNEDVFAGTTKDIVKTVLEGYNSSVFAYGATGAGKTYSMLGNRETPGIIFLTVMELYKEIEKMQDEKSCEVAVSYLEVYNETVRDLFSPAPPLVIREDNNKIIVQGLVVRQPENAEELISMLEFGNSNRTQHPTDANAESSRSHAVFQVYVKQRDRTAGLSTDVKVAKLSLIDLAGSEKGTATGLKGVRFREGASINKSLLALGSCINALADGNKHVPYRNSKLTHLLKDSLGGNCRSVMIAAVSPSSITYEDTYNTLRYADRAKKITIKLKKNVMSVNFHISQYKAIVDQLKEEIAELKPKAKLYDEMMKNQSEVATSCPVEPEAPPAISAEIQSKLDALKTMYEQRRKYYQQLLQMEAQHQLLMFKIVWKQRTITYLERIGLLEERLANASRKQNRAIRILRNKCRRLAKIWEKQKEQICTLEEAVSTEEQQLAEVAELESMQKDATKSDNLSGCTRHALYLRDLIMDQDREIKYRDDLLVKGLCMMNHYYMLLRHDKTVTHKMAEEYDEFVNSITVVEDTRSVHFEDEDVKCSSVESDKNSSWLDVKSYLKLPTLSDDGSPVVSRGGIVGIIKDVSTPPLDLHRPLQEPHEEEIISGMLSPTRPSDPPVPVKKLDETFNASECIDMQTDSLLCNSVIMDVGGAAPTLSETVVIDKDRDEQVDVVSDWTESSVACSSASADSLNRTRDVEPCPLTTSLNSTFNLSIPNGATGPSHSTDDSEKPTLVSIPDIISGTPDSGSSSKEAMWKSGKEFAAMLSPREKKGPCNRRETVDVFKQPMLPREVVRRQSVLGPPNVPPRRPLMRSGSERTLRKSSTLTNLRDNARPVAGRSKQEGYPTYMTGTTASKMKRWSTSQTAIEKLMKPPPPPGRENQQAKDAKKPRLFKTFHRSISTSILKPSNR